jgi:hypothetical protein
MMLHMVMVGTSGLTENGIAMLSAKLVTAARKITNDRSGNFAMVTTLMFFPMVAMVGLSTDLWHAYEVKTKLDQVADAAALAAITTSSKVYSNGSNGTSKTDWDIEARDFFGGNQSLVSPSVDVLVDADIRRDGTRLSSSVSYTADLETTFMKIVGIPFLTIRGTATAEFNVGLFYNVHVLVDNSPSMGIGASRTDVDRMQARMGCAFACHDLSGTMNNLPAVASLGVKLRIDVVGESLGKLADTIADTVSQRSLYKLSLYSLGANATQAVTTPLSKIQNLTQDMDVFKTSVRSVRLMEMPTYDYNNFAVGYINRSINLMNAEIPTAGTGTASINPRQVLLLITDGVVDMLSTASGCYGVYQYGRCVQYINVNECQRLKNRGVIVAVLHTTYLPINGNENYNNWVRPFAPNVGTALQSCASPDLYEPVDVNSDISTALHVLFSKAVGMPRLTM